jgi:hypothetical protein
MQFERESSGPASYQPAYEISKINHDINYIGDVGPDGLYRGPNYPANHAMQSNTAFR